VGRFYDCTLEIFRGLGEMCATHPAFVTTFRKRHPDLPEFLRQAVTLYVGAREPARG
jgi:hypothetical protein